MLGHDATKQSLHGMKKGILYTVKFMILQIGCATARFARLRFAMKTKVLFFFLLLFLLGGGN